MRYERTARIPGADGAGRRRELVGPDCDLRVAVGPVRLLVPIIRELHATALLEIGDALVAQSDGEGIALGLVEVPRRRVPDLTPVVVKRRRDLLRWIAMVDAPGPVEGTSSQAYLRPETAQGIFVNFANVLNSTRMRPPFGIAQIGKAFRNEITPGNSIFRLREFEQMELEYFVPPAEEMKWLDYWKDERFKWYQELGVRPEKLRLRQHGQDELAHYARGAFDVEYEFPFGWSELEGIAARGDFDLSAHQKASGRDLSFFDDLVRERYIPHVVEPSAGVDRTMLTLLIDAYREEEVRGEQRVVLKLHHRVAPIQVAILPLSRKEPLTALARKVEHELRPFFRTEFDDTQSIGKRYRRQDEIGTPFAVTIDFETETDKSATIRSRDEMTQVRVPLAELRQALQERLH